jgi:hypothetical protein
MENKRLPFKPQAKLAHARRSANTGDMAKIVAAQAGVGVVKVMSVEYVEELAAEAQRMATLDPSQRFVVDEIVVQVMAEGVVANWAFENSVDRIPEVKHNGGINYTCEGDEKPSRFVDLRLENNEIYHVDRSGIFGWSDRWERTKWYPSLQVAIRGNILHDIGGDGIVVVATDGAVVGHNVVGRANQRSEGYNVAIWPWRADNTVIQYNEAYGTKGQRDGEGFDSDWNSHNTLIQYNYSHDNDGGFLLICDDASQKPEISAGNTGTIVRYNISVNDRNRGINMAGPAVRGGEPHGARAAASRA